MSLVFVDKEQSFYLWFISDLWLKSEKLMSFSRSQTTKGIWLARCAGIEPCTLVMDLEGTDGRERGEVHSYALFGFSHVLFACTFFYFCLLYFPSNVFANLLNSVLLHASFCKDCFKNNI